MDDMECPQVSGHIERVTESCVRIINISSSHPLSDEAIGNSGSFRLQKKSSRLDYYYVRQDHRQKEEEEEEQHPDHLWDPLLRFFSVGKNQNVSEPAWWE
jgi:hypothetical protein